MSVEQCTSMLALLCIAIECQNIERQYCQLCLRKISEVYKQLLVRLPALRFSEDVNVEEFTASLVSCGLLLRDDDEYECTEGAGAYEGSSSAIDLIPQVGSFSELSGGGTSDKLLQQCGSSLRSFSFKRFTSVAQTRTFTNTEFSAKNIDQAFLSCIPNSTAECATDVVALGVIRGLSFSRSRRRSTWSPELLQRIHELINYFAGSAQRSTAQKNILMLLLEARSATKSGSIQTGHMGRWITSILQESYILNGLCQKDQLQTRVVTSALCLLSGHYQSVAALCARGVSAAPDVEHSDRIVESIWRVLQTAKEKCALLHPTASSPNSGTAAREQRPVTFYGANLQLVLFYLLRVELDRLRCLLVIENTSLVKVGSGTLNSSIFMENSTMEASAFSPAQDVFPFQCYVSEEEENLRLSVIANMLKFILMPSSVFWIVPRKGGGSSVWDTICAMLTRVLSMYTSTGEKGTAGCLSKKGKTLIRRFSTVYYRNLEGIAHLLIDRMIRDGGGIPDGNDVAFTVLLLSQHTTPGNAAGCTGETEKAVKSARIPENPVEGEGETNILKSAARECLLGLCGSHPHLRSFVLSMLFDYLSKASTQVELYVLHPEETITEEGSMLAFDTVCSILIQRACRRSLHGEVYITHCDTLENVMRYTNQVSSSFLNLLRAELKKPGTSLRSMVEKNELPTVGMVATAELFLGVVVRFVDRMQDLVKFSKSISQESWNELCRETLHAVNAVLHRAMSTVIELAWPKSGILFQKAAVPTCFSDPGPINILPVGVIQCMSPYLKIIAVLLQLVPPITAVPSVDEVAFRCEKARQLISGNSNADVEFQHYMSYFSTKVKPETTTTSCRPLFRSLWFLFTLYGIAKDAVSFVAPRLIRNASDIELHNGLTMQRAHFVATCASSARPLILLSSSSLQEVEEDIQILLGTIKDVLGVASLSDKKMRKFLSSYILRVCPQCARSLAQLTLSELFLMNAIFQMELVRAGCYLFSTIPLYHHFDVRESVGSPAIPKVLRHITEYIVTQFVSVSNYCGIPDYAFKMLKTGIRQLLLYAAFAVHSVKESALALLKQLLYAFPMQTVQSGGLILLWRLIDIVDVADPREVKEFCVRMRYMGEPCLAIEYMSAERMKDLQALHDLAEEWVEVGRQRAPQDLLHVATNFVTSGTAEGVSADHVYLGTQLAILAGQISGGTLMGKGKKEENGSSSLIIKFSRARGYVLSSLAHFPLEIVEANLQSRLHRIIVEGRKLLEKREKKRQVLREQGKASLSRENTLTDAYLVQLESEIYAVTVLRNMREIMWNSRRNLSLYLVQAPIKLFNTKAIQIASECWSWIIISQRELTVIPILKNIVRGVEWTIASKLGLFDGCQTQNLSLVETGMVEVQSEKFATGLFSRKAHNMETPHYAIFKFVVDIFLRHDSAMMQNRSVLFFLYLLGSAIVHNPLALSLKEESFLETMEAMVLVGKVIHQTFMLNIRHLRVDRELLVPFSSLGQLRSKWYTAILHWFRQMHAPWHFGRTPGDVNVGIEVLESLLMLLRTEKKALRQSVVGFLDFPFDPDAPGKTIGLIPSVRRTDIYLKQPEVSLEELAKEEQRRLTKLLDLLTLLLNHELLRLRVWQQPRRTLELINTLSVYNRSYISSLDTAVAHDPMVAVAMVKRLSGNFRRLAARLSLHITSRPEHFFHIPEAVDYYLTPTVLQNGAPQLYLFANAGIIQALRLLDKQYSAYEAVTCYAVRSLLLKNPDHLIFYLPQLLQVLGSDVSGEIHRFLATMARNSTMFCHQVLWALRTEGEGSHEMAQKCRALETAILESLSPTELQFYRNEFDFIDRVIAYSGKLMNYPKGERKPTLRKLLKADVDLLSAPSNKHVYLPTNPDFRITGVVPHTASAMQSAAKCPIFVQFEGVSRESDNMQSPDTLPPIQSPFKKACIFKMGDDCRQDQIALQLIELFKRIFHSVDVPFFLYPYRVVTTGQTSGIIECVPNSLSRNEIGKLVESNVVEYFVQTFGHPETNSFRKARENFVRSAAAYSVVTFILNIKDRHNGNIMIDSDGHIIHIDFGFLFDTSPGGDMNFESSPFKLTTEMIQLIGRDVGSSSTLKSKALQRVLVDEKNYVAFKTLTNRCFLAVRQYAREICILVELMLRSGLPCFKPKQTIAHLAQRLYMNHSEMIAADFMRKRIHESKQNVRTQLYDYFQRIVEGIEM